MVEPIMYFAIGFLVSTLLGLAIVPLVHGRAVRLTTRRLEAATPLSMAEIQADKDQLRAEFAMSARRLEMSVDQLKAKTTTQLAELGKKSEAINRMKFELGEKNATIFQLEAREKSVKEQLRATEEEFAAKTQALREAETKLSDKQNELAKIGHQLSDRSQVAEARQVELAAVNTQIIALQHRVNDAEREFTEAQQKLSLTRDELSSATRDLTAARERVENLAQRVNDLEKQLVGQTKEAEMLGSRATDLENRLAVQGKMLAERGIENHQLRQQLDALADLGAEPAPADRFRPRERARVRKAAGRKDHAGRAAHRGARGAQRHAARAQRHQVADGNILGHRAHGKRGAARAHQRYRSRSGQARDHAGGTGLADRGDPCGRGAYAGAKLRAGQSGHERRRAECCERQQARGGGARARYRPVCDEGHPGRPHPRAAEPGLARATGAVRSQAKAAASAESAARA